MWLTNLLIIALLCHRLLGIQSRGTEMASNPDPSNQVAMTCPATEGAPSEHSQEPVTPEEEAGREYKYPMDYDNFEERLAAERRLVEEFEPLSEARILMEDLDSSKHEKWGWVVYRTDYSDDQKWEKFKEEINRRSRVDLITSTDAPGMAERLDWVFLEDKDTLDGASVAQLRQLFRDWADKTMKLENPEAEGHELSYFTNPRYDYFIRANADVIGSVVDDAPHVPDEDPFGFGYVDFVQAGLQAFVPMDADELECHEEFEAIEGCTDEDVGWMRITASMLGPSWYHTMASDSWHVYYLRPYGVLEDY